jgi:hypothetical protein
MALKFKNPWGKGNREFDKWFGINGTALEGAVIPIKRNITDVSLLFNPSGGALRGQDAYGNGHFGAPRSGGARKHMGIDILTIVGQDLVSPVTGKAVNYIGTSSGKPMIDITPSDSAIEIEKERILYVNIPSEINAWSPYTVIGGKTLIGTAANLGDLGYPKDITPHIHVQVMIGGKWVDPTPYFFRY